MSTLPPALNVLSLAAQQDKGKLASGDAWLFLVDVIWSGQHVRLARNVDDVQFDAGDGLGIQTYQKFNFDLSVQQNGNGQLPAITLKCSNVLGILQGFIEEYAGAVGAIANLYFVNTAHAAGEANIALSSIILHTTCTYSSVDFDLGAPKPQQQLFPRFLYRADFCMWVSTYKGIWCGYTGPLPNCDGTYNGPDGCVAHANQQRFGAFPGIGTNGASIASQT
jgi:phage-related protein